MPAPCSFSARGPKPHRSTSGPTVGSQAPPLACAQSSAQASTVKNSGGSACQLPGSARLKREMSEPASQLLIWRTTRRSEEHTSELQSPCNLVCRLLLEKKKQIQTCVAPHSVIYP